MTASITYSEAQDLISREFNIRPDLAMADDRTLCVSYNPGLLIPTVKVNVRIEAIKNDSIILSYNCQPAVALIVKGALALLGEKIPHHIIQINTDNKHAVINLRNVKQLESALKYMSLNDIYIEAHRINVDLHVK